MSRQMTAICNCCPVLHDCKAAFGAYWEDKSNGGKGCSVPFPGWGKPKMPKMPRRPVRVTQTELGVAR